MLYHLLFPLSDQFVAFNVFRYITFRAAGATVTALLLCLLLGPAFIEWLRRLSVGQNIREEGPQSHKTKAGTPTMGGLLILLAVLVPTLLWAQLTNPYIWVVIGVTSAFGLVGFLDDYLKIRHRRNLGLTARAKFLAQAGAAGELHWLMSHEGAHCSNPENSQFLIGACAPHWISSPFRSFRFCRSHQPKHSSEPGMKLPSTITRCGSSMSALPFSVSRFSCSAWPLRVSPKLTSGRPKENTRA